MGASVVLGVRNTKAAEEVVKQIQKKHPGAKVTIGPSLDLMSQDSVRKFAEAMNKQFSRIDILVNNAGVSFMGKCFTEDGVGGIAQVRRRVWKAGFVVKRRCCAMSTSVSCGAAPIPAPSITPRPPPPHTHTQLPPPWARGGGWAYGILVGGTQNAHVMSPHITHGHVTQLANAACPLTGLHGP